MSSQNKIKHENFQITCGKCFLALERYKLKTNLLGCNMNFSEFNQFYKYYESKPAKRLETAREKIAEMVRSFEKNALYLHALELKTINNMMKNYRSRMDLSTNEPTDFNYAKFEKEESELMDAIILNEIEKLPDFNDLLTRVQKVDKDCCSSVKDKLEGRKQKPKYERAFKIISRAEIRYAKYYETFERNVTNMVNQLYSHIDKLSQFYTVWENLGSSMIYKVKSDREVRIDKTIQERKSNYYYIDENEEDIKQVIEVMPENSKLRIQYEIQLKENEKNKEEENSKLEERRTKLECLQGNPDSHKGHYMSVNKATWYENIEGDKKQFSFTDNIVLRESDEDGFFRYTYEELHAETLEYLEEMKEKKVKLPALERREQDDRYYIHEQRRAAERQASQRCQLETFNVAPHMNFNCWYDRLGPKGYFNVQDFPMNMVQRRIEFEHDRQFEMEILDERRKMDYNRKENQLANIDDHRQVNMGYRFFDSQKELKYYIKEFLHANDPEFLPKPKPKKQIIEDFSDSDEENNVQTIKQDSPKKRTGVYILSPEKKEREIVQIPAFVETCNQLATKKKSFEIFIESYLPEFEKSMIVKDDDECDLLRVGYFYLENCHLGTLQKKVKKKNSYDKIFLVSNTFLVHLSYIYFGNDDYEIKVEVYDLGFDNEETKLQNNLSRFFEPMGTCKFKWIKPKMEPNQLSCENFLIGLIFRLRNGNEEEFMLTNIDGIIEEGSRVFKPFKNYSEHLNQL